jgi:hypothetical protein
MHGRGRRRHGRRLNPLRRAARRQTPRRLPRTVAYNSSTRRRGAR